MSEPTFLSATRTSYDAVAAAYARMCDDSLADRPADRAVLGLFAELVRSGGGRKVVDIGCGPGYVTAYLRTLGLDAFGLDLSPGMLTQAQAAHPEIHFQLGSMTQLDLPDAGVDGILALYSIIHLPVGRRPEVFTEFHRILTDAGQILLQFQVRPQPRRVTSWLNQDVELEYDRLDADEIADQLSAAGFHVHLRALREPDNDTETVPRAYVLASKRNRGSSRGGQPGRPVDAVLGCR